MSKFIGDKSQAMALIEAMGQRNSQQSDPAEAKNGKAPSLKEIRAKYRKKANRRY